MMIDIKFLTMKIPKDLHAEIKKHARRHDYASTKEFCLAAILKLMLEQKGKGNEQEKRS